MGEKIKVHIYISGDVHGVNFRTNTAQRAMALNLNGWIKNTLKGVEAVFEGGAEEIEQIFEWMKHGPRHAIVEKYEIIQEQYQDEFKDFKIIHE